MLLWAKSSHSQSPLLQKEGRKHSVMSSTQAGSQLFKSYALLVMELGSLWCLF